MVESLTYCARINRVLKSFAVFTPIGLILIHRYFHKKLNVSNTSSDTSSPKRYLLNAALNSSSFLNLTLLSTISCPNASKALMVLRPNFNVSDENNSSFALIVLSIL
jgi:hypothetical protein